MYGIEAFRREPVMRHEVKQPPVEPKEKAELALAEACRAMRDGVKHRLDVGRRARDDAQDLARRGLLLKVSVRS
jgi:hypothetical protein